MFKDRKFSRAAKESPGQRYKKRKTFPVANELDTKFTSESAEKLSSSSNLSPTITTTAYVILHFVEVFSELSKILKCKECNDAVEFGKSGGQGLGFKLIVSCKCGEKGIHSSPQIASKSYEINRRAVFVMRLLGVGFHGLNCFCSLMDIGHGFAKNLFYAAVNNIHIASKSVFHAVVKKAGEEEKRKTVGDGLFTVSGDATCSKRGFTSSNFGVMTLTGNTTSKVLDLIVKSQYCQDCDSMENKKGTAEYDSWWDEHESVCSISHKGSAGKMEVDGIVEMVERALELHGISYKRYVGVGEKFTALLNLFPDIVKVECINDVEQRMDTELCSVKSEPREEDQSGDAGPDNPLGGFTQNDVESFNKTIWQFAPEHVHCGSRTIEIAAYMAACIFNEGFNPILKMMQVMGIRVGFWAQKFNTDRHEDRIQDAHWRALYKSREAPTARKRAKLQEEEYEVVEGLLYSPGRATIQDEEDEEEYEYVEGLLYGPGTAD